MTHTPSPGAETPKSFLIDGIENCIVNPLEFSNECMSLEDLKIGLFALYRKVKYLEGVYLKQNPTKRGWDRFMKLEGVDQTDLDIVPSMFHWFATSLYNFVRLSGYVKYRSDGTILEHDLINKKKVKELCKTYEESIPELANVRIWRNKVAAHFATTMPYRDDTTVGLYQSIAQPIAFWVNHRYTAGIVVFDIEGELSSYPQWSLTAVFESLFPRYWPTGDYVKSIEGFVLPGPLLDSGMRQPNAVIGELIIEQDGPPTSELVDFKIEYIPK